MNARSRNRSPITPSDISEMQPFSHGRLTSSLPLWMLGPSLLQPPFSSFVWFKMFFSLLSSLCANSVNVFLFVLSSITFLFTLSNFDFPVFQDSAAPTLPLSLAYCLCQMSWLLFFSPFSSLTPSLPASTLPLSSSLSLQETYSLALCTSPLVIDCLLLSLIHLLHLPQCSINKVCCVCVCACLGASDRSWVTQPDSLCVVTCVNRPINYVLLFYKEAQRSMTR